jgi:hypothetical protein
VERTKKESKKEETVITVLIQYNTELFAEEN